ncbi:MAG: M48 family metallopeptidase [Cytophagales bacterium]|nr:M48 family metallopeptidase [Cytophagales bacterium]
MEKVQLKYGNSTIHYDLEYANRKTLGIKVHPDKTVQVIAPLGSDPEKVKEKVYSKAAWIMKQQDFFLSFEPQTPPRKYISGETHLYLGKQYRLKLETSTKESVKLQGGNITVYLKDTTNSKRVKTLMAKWYKEKAKNHFEKLFSESLTITKGYYNNEPELKYRWMDKRWGSCDKKGTIHLNLELIKAPKQCIEYVIIHEICHINHLNHSTAFYNQLEKIFPDWKKVKDRLEKIMV